MNQKISQKQLYSYLEQLKQAIASYSGLENTIYLNSHAFYACVKDYLCENGQTIGTLLKHIEQCIPFSLTDDSFSLFLSAYEQENPKKMEALRQGFVESCKADFLLLLFHCKTDSDWASVRNTCENLRVKHREAFYT